MTQTSCLSYISACSHEHHSEKHVFIIDWKKVTDHVIFMSQTHLNEPQKTKTWDLSKLTEKCVWSSDSRWIYEVQLLFSELNVFSFQVLFCSAGPFQPSSPDPQPYTVSSYWNTVYVFVMLFGWNVVIMCIYLSCVALYWFWQWPVLIPDHSCVCGRVLWPLIKVFSDLHCV